MKPYLNISLCLLFVTAICLTGHAQSGRRAPKPLSPPTATPTPKETEQPSPQNKPALKQQSLIVGIDGAGQSLYIPTYMSDSIWNGFDEQFKKHSSITIVTDRDMRRKEAIDRAKNQRESFVVLLQLSTESLGAGMSQVRAEDLVVSFVIFSPVTGKTEDQGRVYVRSYRGVLSRRLPTSRTDEAQLNEAGRETARRVMSALHMGSTAIRN